MFHQVVSRQAPYYGNRILRGVHYTYGLGIGLLSVKSLFDSASDSNHNSNRNPIPKKLTSSVTNNTNRDQQQ
jgi:hypothetical protein